MDFNVSVIESREKRNTTHIHTTISNFFQWLDVEATNSVSITAHSDIESYKRRCKAFTFCVRGGDPRRGQYGSAGTVSHVSGFGIDIDSGTPEMLETIQKKLASSEITYYIYETIQSRLPLVVGLPGGSSKHECGPGIVRFRALIPFDRAYEVQGIDMEIDYQATIEAFCATFGIQDRDTACDSVERVFYPPVNRNDLLPDNSIFVESSCDTGVYFPPVRATLPPIQKPIGGVHTPVIVPRQQTLTRRPTSPEKGRNNNIKNELKRILAITPTLDGVRRVNPLNLATYLTSYDQRLTPENPLFSDKTEPYHNAPNPALKFITSIIKSLNGPCRGNRSEIVPVEEDTHDTITGVPLEGDVAYFDDGDKGASERFLHMFGDRVRWDTEIGKWWVYRDTDGTWELSEEKAYALCQEACLLTLQSQIEACKREGGDDAESNTILKKLLKLWRSYCSVTGIRGAMTQSRSASEIHCTTSQFNPESSDYLLACSNGVVDLRTGELGEFSPEYMMTMNTEVEYNPNSDQSYIRHIVAGIFPDAGDQEAIRRWFGYTLLGRNPEKKFFVLYGPLANNGKTTIQYAIHKAMGRYAVAVDSSTLLGGMGDRSGGHSDDVARLVGARGVFVSEIPRDQKLNENRIKNLAGDNDTITASRKGEKNFNFRFGGKITIATNNDPEKSNDKGLWERILMIECKQQFAPDASIGIRLAAERAAVLAWAVGGCVAYCKDIANGIPGRQALRISENMEAHLAMSRSEVNQMERFMEACVIRTELNEKMLAKELYAVYEQWCRRSTEISIPLKAFIRELRATPGLGFRLVGAMKNLGVFGIRLSEVGRELDDEAVFNVTRHEYQ